MNLVKSDRNGRCIGKHLSKLTLAYLIFLVGLIIAAPNQLKRITGFPELGFISRWQRGELGVAGADLEGIEGENRNQNELCRQSHQPNSDAFYDSIYDLPEAIHKSNSAIVTDPAEPWPVIAKLYLRVVHTLTEFACVKQGTSSMAVSLTAVVEEKVQSLTANGRQLQGAYMNKSNNPGMSPEAWKKLHKFFARVQLKRALQAKVEGKGLRNTLEVRNSVQI